MITTPLLVAVVGVIMLSGGALALWSMDHVPDCLLERSLWRSLSEPGRINPERLGFAGTMLMLVGAAFLLVALYDARGH